jgi:FKBP-type peptidyl-prolyl cis-trans isomerase
MWEMRSLRFAALLALLAFGLTSASAATGPLSPDANQAFLTDNAKKQGVMVRPSGLQYHILRGGFGKRAAAGDTVQVQYSSSLINGTVFDGTSPGLPATLAVSSVIRGLSEALQLMREGDHWQLVIPPSLAFGAKGSGTIVPPDQALVFDVTLVSLAKASGPAAQDDRQISLSAMNREQGATREQGAILTIPQ